MKKFKLLLWVLLFCCSGYLIKQLVIDPLQIDKKQHDIQTIYYQQTSSSQSTRESFYDLAAINSDIKAWIRVSNSNIDYPVLQAGQADAEYYLDHDYKKVPSREGSIFAGASVQLANDDLKPIILYGHTLQNGRMFSELKKYREIEFLKQNQSIYFDRQFGNSQWKIISVFLANVLEKQGSPFNYTRTEFKDENDYLNFIYQIRIRSLFNIDTSVNGQDKLLLLSTCADDFENFRLVVVARQLREGESNTPAQISENPKVLYPDCWYQKNHAVKPNWPTDYQNFKGLNWFEK